MSNWEQIKNAEKGRESLMDGIPVALPSLLFANKVQRKARSVDSTGPMSGSVGQGRRGAGRGAREPARGRDRGPPFSVVNVARLSASRPRPPARRHREVP